MHKPESLCINLKWSGAYEIKEQNRTFTNLHWKLQVFTGAYNGLKFNLLKGKHKNALKENQKKDILT